MEARTRELQELAKQQRFRPSDEVATFKILKSIKEVIATTVPIILSAKEEFLWLSNQEGVEFSEVLGILQQEREFIERGGQCRGITDISYRLIDTIRHLLDIGADVRHFGDYRGAYFGVLTKSTASVQSTLMFNIVDSMRRSACSTPTILCLLTISSQLSKCFGSKLRNVLEASCSGGRTNTRAFRTETSAGISRATLGKMLSLA
jgi:hypothetical protein